MGLSRKVRFRVLAATTATLVPLLLGEAAVRIFCPVGYVTPGILRELELPYATATFSKHVFDTGGRDVTYDVFGGQTQCRINAQGYRGPDFEPRKPAGTVRVIVYGGSTVFDLAAPKGHDWPRLLHAELQERGLQRVEVVNAGIPGTDASDAFGRLFAEGHVLEPDVVVFYGAWNDLRNLDSRRPLLRRRTPYRATDDPRITYQGSVDRALCNVSQLYVRLRSRYFTWRLDVGPEGRRGPVATDDGDSAPVGGATQYELAVRMFVALAREIGAVPVLVTQARLVAPGNTESQRGRINYRTAGSEDHEALCAAFARTDTILSRAADPEGTLLVDASEHMTSDPQWFHDHVHTTASGSRRLATLLADALEPVLRER